MKYETRGVLAGRYRAGQMERVTHTHLAEPDGESALCNKKIGMADSYSCTEEERRARPTCPKCAKRYDKEAMRDTSTKKRKPARDHACSCHSKPAKKKVARKPRKPRKAPKRDATKTCGMGTEIQSLFLSQQHFTEKQAVGWAKRHGFRVIKVDVTANNYRFRQHPPSNFEPGSFRTIRIRPGVGAVIGCPT